jgi:four helix bundle protein
MALVQKHTDLRVYQLAFDTAMTIYQLSKQFPVEERYSLTDQMRRSSRSVCANLAEAWRKRRYDAAFVAKLSDCEAEAAETQTWIAFAIQCQYFAADEGKELLQKYDQILGMLVNLIKRSSEWSLPKPK